MCIQRFSSELTENQNILNNFNPCQLHETADIFGREWGGGGKDGSKPPPPPLLHPIKQMIYM